MKVLTRALVLALFSVSTATVAFAEGGDMKADNDAINSSCSADAATAGCGSETVGHGLLKCLHAYKKSHKDFKFSEGCKDAMKKRHEDRKEHKK